MVTHKTKIGLKVEDQLWLDFRSTFSREIQINDAIVGLIESHVKKWKSKKS